MSLEVAPTLGACYGAYLATRVSTHWIAIVFGLVLLYSAIASFRQRDQAVPEAAKVPNAFATKLELNGVYPGPQGGETYTAQRVPLGFGTMFGAGTLSGLLGIGSGAVKVLAMDQAMKLVEGSSALWIRSKNLMSVSRSTRRDRPTAVAGSNLVRS